MKKPGNIILMAVIGIMIGLLIAIPAISKIGFQRARGVSDTAYNATTWDGVIFVAPSKNAVRDKIEALQGLHASLTSIAGLTEADVSILETTADDVYAVVTSGGNNYFFGSASDNLSLEFKTPAATRTALDLEAGTDFYSIAAADAAFEAELNNSAGLLAALDDETGTGVAVFSNNPRFVGDMGIGSAILLETDLEILDEAATEGLTHAELMYLKDFTGTSGTGAICGNISPQLTTPDIGAATGDSLTLDAAAFPKWVHRDSDGGDTDKSCATYGAGFSDTTSGAEISDFAFTGWGAGTAGTAYTHLFWDGSDSHLYMGVLANYTGANPSVAPLDLANYESLVWDFDAGTDLIEVSSPVSGTKTVDFGTIDLQGSVLTASYSSAQTLSARECRGGVIYVTGAAVITLPAVADGASVSVVTIGAIAVSVKAGASDLILLDGTALDDADKITNTSTSGDIAVLTYYDATGWYASTNSWTDGGA